MLSTILNIYTYKAIADVHDMTGRIERDLQKKADDVWGDHYKHPWGDINKQEEYETNNLYKILNYVCDVRKKLDRERCCNLLSEAAP